jgi:hypothetical protein
MPNNYNRKAFTSMLTATIALTILPSSNMGAVTLQQNTTNNPLCRRNISDSTEEMKERNPIINLSFKDSPKKRSFKNLYAKIGKSETFKSSYYNKSIGDIIAVED